VLFLAELQRGRERHNLCVFTRDTDGYVFSQVHNILQDVPVENVEAM